MATSGLTSRVQEPDLDLKEPGTRVEQELRDIVRQAERGSRPIQRETAGWYYWVPQPGIRYYCHELWPPPLAPAKQTRGALAVGR